MGTIEEEKFFDRPHPGSRLRTSQISRFIAQSGPMSMSLVARSTITDDISAPSEHHHTEPHESRSRRPTQNRGSRKNPKTAAFSPTKIPPFSLVLVLLGRPAPSSGEKAKTQEMVVFVVDSVAEEAKVVVSRRIVRGAAVFRRAQQNLTNSDDADCSFPVGFAPPSFVPFAFISLPRLLSFSFDLYFEG